MDKLWAQFLLEMQERVAILVSAAESSGAGMLDAEQKQRAASAAHKLAGVLGTFGLARGTELARELELSYSEKELGGAMSSEKQKEATAELRAIVESRK
jgi:HPt (histidine-containing phosphotransfer) domain-containing protein